MTDFSLLPRIVIAGTHSGTGKTTMTLGLILALKRKGLRVQPFKVGPDYIDPGFHTLASGIDGRNLDSVMTDESGVRELFVRSARKSDISVIEGVMGLYDGFSGDSEWGSTAHIAKILQAPVILCMDVRAMARSAAALALGYVKFDPATPIRGFVLNNVGSENHYLITKKAVEDNTGTPVVGYLPKREAIVLPERHLGLVPAWERDSLPASSEVLADLIETYIDLDKICAIAGNKSQDLRTDAPDLSPGTAGVDIPDFTTEQSGSVPEASKTKLEAKTAGAEGRRIFTSRIHFSNTGRPRIGYALDDAFHFYYRDNLDILEYIGADLVPFRPTSDPHLPEGLDGLYFGGGYPELSASRLEENRSMREEVRSVAESGLPMYAECGGLMYLVDSLVTFEGDTYKMAGIFEGRVIMEKKLAALGYYRAIVRDDTPIAEKGWTIWGHVFHWSRLEGVPENQSYAFFLEKEGKTPISDGLLSKNVLAGYFHIHFGGDVRWPERFVSFCRENAKKRKS